MRGTSAISVPGGVALALAVAAGLHLAAFPHHVEEGGAVAGFFLVTAVLQLAGAMLILRGTDRGGRAMVATGNLGLIVLWAVSRSVGIPGAHGGGREPVALLDLAAVAAEAALVVGLLILDSRPSPARLSAGRMLPALTLTAFVVCGAALRFAPPSDTGEVRRSPSVDVPVAHVDTLTPHVHDDHPHPRR